MPINTSFLTVLILSFWGIRQAYCPYAFRFSEIYEKKISKIFRGLRVKEREREREKKKERKRKREKERERRKNWRNWRN